MQVDSTHIPGVFVIAPKVREDERGFFMESFRQDRFSEAGLLSEYVQDNHSRSGYGIVRGLHFQWEKPMAKLMRVTRGKALLVAVDIRKNSPTLGQHFAVEASEENKIEVYAPAGFARGFCSLSEITEIQYKCTAFYNPEGESGIYWNDPALGVEWPIKEPVLSEKDKNAQTLEMWLARPEADAFIFDPENPNR